MKIKKFAGLVPLMRISSTSRMILGAKPDFSLGRFRPAWTLTTGSLLMILGQESGKLASEMPAEYFE